MGQKSSRSGPDGTSPGPSPRLLAPTASVAPGGAASREPGTAYCSSHLTRDKDPPFRWPSPRRRPPRPRAAAAGPAPGCSIARPQRLPPVPQRQAAARGLPDVRVVQGPPGPRRWLSRRRNPATRRAARSRSARPVGETRPVAVDAMGGDRAPAEIVAGAIQAAEAGLAVVLVGDPDRLGDTGGLPVIPAREIIEMHEDPGRAVRTKKDSSLVRAAEAVRDGTAVGHGQRRQHRGDHGQRPVSHGPHPGRGPAGDRHPDSGARDHPDRAARRRRQRRVHRRLAGAVRPDGLGVRQAALRHRRSPGRPAVDRRGAGQGQPAGQGDLRPARRRRRPDPACASSATSRAAT